jgi:hypothetical protein
MKNYLKIYLGFIIVAFIISLLFSQGEIGYGTGFVFGTMNLIVGGLLLFIGLIALFAKDKSIGKNILAAAGLILLTGGIFCSIFPFSMNGH